MLKRRKARIAAEKDRAWRIASDRYLVKLRNSLGSLSGVHYSHGMGGGDVGETLAPEEIRAILSQELERHLEINRHDSRAPSRAMEG